MAQTKKTSPCGGGLREVPGPKSDWGTGMGAVGAKLRPSTRSVKARVGASACENKKKVGVDWCCYKRRRSTYLHPPGRLTMIPDSLIARTLIYAVALLQTAVAPFAFVYFVYYLAKDRLLFQLHPTLDAWLHYWLGSELIFYIFFQITRNRMQRQLSSVAPSVKERRELYVQCLANIDMQRHGCQDGR